MHPSNTLSIKFLTLFIQFIKDNFYMNNQKIEGNGYDTIAAVGIRAAAEHLRLPINLRL